MKNNTELYLKEIMLIDPERLVQAFEIDLSTGRERKVRKPNVFPRLDYILKNLEYEIEDDLDGIPPSIIIHYCEKGGSELDKVYVVHIFNKI